MDDALAAWRSKERGDTVKQALLIQDAGGGYNAPPEAMARVLEDVLGDLYELSCLRDYGQLSYETLKGYHGVILAGVDWDRFGSKASAAALISYVACGGAVLALGDTLRTTGCFELNCLFGARLLGVGTPCLLDLAPTGDHAVTRDAEPVSLVEYPCFYELDPILEPEVVAKLRYAAREYPAAWCHRYGWGRVFCLAVGNLPGSYLPPVRRLVWRAAAWLLNRL